MGADLTFKDLITLLHFELTFSKAQDSIIIHLISKSDIILLIAEVKLCKKKSFWWEGLVQF